MNFEISCECCNKILKTNKLYKFHKKFDCEIKKYKPHECKICGNVLTTIGRLKRHIKILHVTNIDINVDILIPCVWNVVFSYIYDSSLCINNPKSKLFIYHMINTKNREMLKCLYISNNFSINNSFFSNTPIIL